MIFCHSEPPGGFYLSLTRDYILSIVRGWSHGESHSQRANDIEQFHELYQRVAILQGNILLTINLKKIQLMDSVSTCVDYVRTLSLIISIVLFASKKGHKASRKFLRCLHNLLGECMAL